MTSRIRTRNGESILHSAAISLPQSPMVLTPVSLEILKRYRKGPLGRYRRAVDRELLIEFHTLVSFVATWAGCYNLPKFRTDLAQWLREDSKMVRRWARGRETPVADENYHRLMEGIADLLDDAERRDNARTQRSKSRRVATRGVSRSGTHRGTSSSRNTPRRQRSAR